ncbi:hypothetical protein [Fundidesulfovibrio terrae]|uniref:hypothetical protein n=1 Tax=Fundidesulfovibrio terrae TaxID=2922866 RepID=UPI001FAFBE5B|nr:hypothetical protein [Fundidesulfovibrio terrae]
MKKHGVLTALFLVLVVSQAWAQSTYSGELIFSQGDFRQLDVLGSGPVTGGVSGNNLIITSTGGNFSYQNSSNSLDWSISLDKTAAAAMVSGTGVTTYTGYFTYGQPQGAQTVIGSGQLNGSVSNGVLSLQTYNGRMGVSGVIPANTVASDWNTAAFNWNMSMPVSTVRLWLGM